MFDTFQGLCCNILSCHTLNKTKPNQLISFNISMRFVNDLNEQLVKLLGTALLNSLPARRLS